MKKRILITLLGGLGAFGALVAYSVLTTPKYVNSSLDIPQTTQATESAPPAPTPQPAPTPAPPVTTAPAQATPTYTPPQYSSTYTYTKPAWDTPNYTSPYTPTSQQPYQATPPTVQWQTKPTNNCYGASSVGC